MADSSYQLHPTPNDSSLTDDLAARHPRVGLEGLLKRGLFTSLARRARRVGSPLPAVVDAYAWDPRDDWSPNWWPQGIDVDPSGRPVVVVSWYAPRRRGQPDSRLTFVDLRGRFPRYRHVLLVEPRRSAAGRVRMAPVSIHAGGVAWHGDRILVAASSGGIREFRIDDILQLRRGAFAVIRRGWRQGFGGRHVLPQSASYRATGAPRGLRFSFLSIDSAGPTGSSETPYLVAGEFSRRGGARLMRFPVLGADSPVEVSELHEPGITGMQGAVVADGTWYVTASAGDKADGDLWVGDPDVPDGFHKLEGAVPSGPEDVTWWPQRRQLWSHSEWPGRRVIFAVDPTRLPA